MEIQFCMGCLRVMSVPGRCPFCGFDQKETPPQAHQLPYETILAGRYLTGKVLREGNASITYIGIDLTKYQRVTIKEYYPKGLVTRRSGTAQGCAVRLLRGADPAVYADGMKRFLSVGQSLAGLGALPGLLQVTDILMGYGTAYMITADECGEFLEQRLSNGCGRLAAAEVLYMMRPLIQTLEKVHKAGLIHGGICSENILIDHRQVWLVDFEAHTNLYNEIEGKGTLRPCYSALEQYEKSGNKGPWTDVYGICAVIHRALTGKAPEEMTQLLKKWPRRREKLSLSHSDEPMPLDEFSSAALSHIYSYWNIDEALKNGLILSPNGRYKSMELLERALYLPEEAPELNIFNPRADFRNCSDWMKLNGLPKGLLLHDRYEVEERVDHGVFGNTYTGFDRQAHIRVKIWEYAHCDFCYDHIGPENILLKVNPQYKDAFDRGMRIFSDDARRLIKLGAHPGIAVYSDYFYEHGTLYIIMEDVRGETLAEYGRKLAGRISFTQVMNMLGAVMDGLELLHRYGLLHGAIDPERIIMDHQKRGKLTDFSEAERFMPEDTKVYGERWKKKGRVIKSNTAPLLIHKYMAPEYANSCAYGPWTDVYGICAVTYGVLVGEKPVTLQGFSGENAIFGIRELLSALGVPITKAEEAILRKGMAFQSGDRYQSITELKRALSSL